MRFNISFQSHYCVEWCDTSPERIANIGLSSKDDSLFKFSLGQSYIL
jgi:hypothetical protein